MRQHRSDPAAIEAEIARLRSLALDALRRRWRVIFGRTPPAALSKELLGRMIACRLQEQAFGGLDRESLWFLDGLTRHGGSPRRQLKPGTVLVRDYHGQRHTVTVARDGFDWQGTIYPSLSAIARAITGTAWSGPRFFALAPRNGTTTRNNKRSARAGRHGPQPVPGTGLSIMPHRAARPPLAHSYDGIVCLVLDDFGELGRAYRETDAAQSDPKTVVADLLSGQYRHPLRVGAFNIPEAWARDVSADLARQ